MILRRRAERTDQEELDSGATTRHPVLRSSRRSNTRRPARPVPRRPSRNQPSRDQPSRDQPSRDHGRRRRWSLPRIDWSDDRGQVGGIEVLPFGLLIFVIGSLLIANAWAVIDTKSAVDAATREGVRVFVEAPDEHRAAAWADAVAREAISGHGRNGAKLVIEAPVYDDGGGFERCAGVTLRARYPVPAITLPWLGGFGEAFQVSSSHREIVDPYRSGLQAGGSC